jgi:hypothetical protein
VDIFYELLKILKACLPKVYLPLVGLTAERWGSLAL